MTFTVTDPEGGVAKQTVNFTVVSVNDPPVMKDIPSQRIKEKETFKDIALNEYVEDLDHDFAKLKWTVSGNKDLKVQISGKTAKILTPSALWNGEETVTFKVTDPEGASDERTVTFTVESVNDVPEFVKQIPDQKIQEKQQFKPIKLDDFVKDADHKNADLKWEVEVKAAKGSAAGLDVKVDENRVATVSVPEKYWNGAADVTFTVTDPEGASVKQTVNFTVTSVNDAPAFVKQIPDQKIQEKEEFKTFALSELIKDPDHDFAKLKISVSGNKDLQVNVSKSGEVTVKQPDKLWNGSEKVTFTITDPEGASVKQAVNFTAVSVNDPPVMKDIPSQRIKEKETFKDIALNEYVEDLDHDFAKLKWTVSGNKDLKVQISGKTAKILTPSALWNGEETVTFKVTDPEGASDERTVTFTVESVNDVPEFVKQIPDQKIQEKQQFKPIKLDDFVKDEDHKNSDLKWSFDIKPVKGSASGLDVKVDDNRTATVVIPNKFWNGAADITFTVTDPEGASVKQTVNFTVVSVNDAPVFVKQLENQSIKEKASFKDFNLTEFVKDNDHEFGKLKIVVTGNKDLKVTVGKDGIVSVKTPNELWNGTEKVTFTITDPEGAAIKQTVTYAVASENDPPVFVKTIPDQQIKEKQEFKPIKLDDFVKDLDHPNSKLKWSFAGNKTLKFAVDQNRQLKVTIPNKYWNGSEKVTFTVTDPEGAKASQEVNFTVESVNDAPAFTREVQDQTIDEKKQFAQIRLRDMVKDFDHRPEQLQWSYKSEVAAIEQPTKKKGKKSKAKAEVKESELKVGITQDGIATILIPNKNWHGAAKITFTVTDPEGAQVSSSAVFTVRSVNDAPVISKNAPTGETIREGEKFKTIVLSTLATDADHSANRLKWEITGNKKLIVKINKDNTVNISVPDAQWNGKETLTFKVTDPEGASDTHKMTFTVSPVNDAPKIGKIANQKIKEKQRFKTVKLDEFVKDPDNKPSELKWTILNQKDIKKGLKVEITSSRQLNVSTENQYFWCEPQPIRLKVTDPQGAFDTATVVYEIVSVNDAPVMKDIPSQRIKEKGAFKDINLDQFVFDSDHKKEQLVWTAKVEKVESEAKPAPKKKKGKKSKKKAKKEESAPAAEPDMTVSIDEKHVAHILLPSKNWNGVRKITFTVTDPTGAKDSKSATFEVESVNDAPVLKKIADQTIKEKERFQPISLGELASDPDHKNSELKFSVSGNRALKASVNAKNQLVVTTSDKYWNGSETLTITVTDPLGAKAVQQARFTITPVNDAPKIVKIANQTVQEKGRFEPIDLSRAANDPDNKANELKWSVSGNKDLKIEIRGTRANVVIPDKYWNGSETVVFKVTDPQGAFDEQKVTFTVKPVNDAPVFKTMKPVEIKEKGSFAPIRLADFVSDPDNKIEELQFTLDDEEPAAPSKKGKKGKKGKRGKKAKSSSVKHELIYTFDKGMLNIEVPDPYWNGSETVKINVFDPSGAKASTQAKFVVQSVNDAPRVSEIPGQTTLEGKPFKTIALDKYVSDPDNKASEMKWSVTGNRNLNVQINGSRVATISPKRSDWYGEETLTFVVRDPAGATAKASAKFVIKHVNATPVMKDIPDYTIKEDQNGGVLAVLKLNQLAMDKDHRFNQLKWTFSGNKYLTVKHDKYKNTVTIAQPYSHWKGAPEKITFTVTDPEGAKASKTAKFTVIAVNNPPEAMAQHYQTQEGTALRVPSSEGLMTGASDADNEKPVKVILVSKPRNGTVDLNERDGSFVYEPKKGFSGLDEFSFKLQDKGGAMSKETTAEVNVRFKMRDLRSQNAAPAVEKKEEPKAQKSKAKKASKKKKGKKRR